MNNIVVELFNSREELEAKHGFMCAMGTYAGPVHLHGEEKFIQIYIGQHEWIGVNINNPTDIRIDPGWAGKEFGYGIVFFPDKQWAYTKYLNHNKKLEPPISNDPPITTDELLFGDKEKVEKYLARKLDE